MGNAVRLIGTTSERNVVVNKPESSLISLSNVSNFLATLFQPEVKGLTSKPKISAGNALLNSREAIISASVYLSESLFAANTLHARMRSVEALIHHLCAYPESRMLPSVKRLSSLLHKWQRGAQYPIFRDQLTQSLTLLGNVPRLRSNGIRLLSIDGGGVRGVMALEILERLESICHGARIHQLFDYVVGVSTGAIICAMIAGLELSVKECKQIYRLFSSRVFEQNKVVGSLGLLLSHSYYNTDNFMALLRQICGEKTLLDTSTKVFPKLGLVACIVNETKLNAFIFRNYGYPSNTVSVFPGGCNFRLWEALKASAAAPGYFQDCKVNGYILQDGGIIANNPTAVGIHESRALWSSEAPFQCVVSIGNGTFAPLNTRKDAESFTVRDKIIKIIDSATETEKVHVVLSDLLPASHYYRLNPYMSAPYSLDDYSEEVMSNMRQDAVAYIEKNMVKLHSIADKLLERKSVTQKLRSQFS